MADLDRAIAAAREALLHTPDKTATESCAIIARAALRARLAALDAAQGEAVLFVKAEQLADHRVSGMNAVRAGHQDHARGLHTVPLYLAPQAPPAAVPAGYMLIESSEVESICRTLERDGDEYGIASLLRDALAAARKGE